MCEKHSFLWSAPQDFPSEHLLDPKVLQDFVAFLEGHKGHGAKGQAVAKYLKDYSKSEGIKFALIMRFLRVIMTGSAEGPPVGEMVEVIGVGRSLDRVKHGLKVIQSS